MTEGEAPDRLRVDRVDIGAVRPEDWARLAEASRNLFATSEFLGAWWRHFGNDRELLLRACSDPGGTLVGLLPLYRWRRRGLDVVRFLGHGPGDQLGPICAPESRPDVARALAAAVDELGCDVFLAEHLPVAEGWRPALGSGRIVREEGSPVVEGDNFDDYLATRSGHFRRKLRWQERKLAEGGRVVYRLADEATLGRDLETLFGLHGSRWRTETEFVAHADFHREFAATAFDRGWLRLWQLELDDAPIASLYTFRFGGREWHVQSGRDPRITAVSPGMLLLAHSLRVALEEGVHEYLMLRGGEDYKYRFATADARLESVVFGLTLRGRGAVLAGATADRLGPLGARMRRGLRRS